VTLQELRYLVALADKGHFMRAAEACHVGQPTLSTQLKKLEEYLGVTLFERNKHRLQLTPIGEQIVVQARIALSVVLVALPGLLMGALLPSGVRTANALGPEVVPWAWGLNGATSVMGSILAITVSMNFGFTSTLFAGIAAYLVGLVALPRVS